MAGHSQFKNIMYRKGAQDKKRAKVFTKLDPRNDHGGPIRAARSGRQSAAARGGHGGAAGRTCRRTRSSARSSAAPAAGGEANYEEVRYEGYGPGGVAVIVEALTDNRNRTASEVRAAFTKAGGALGETNSVSLHVRPCRRDRLSGQARPSADDDARGRDRGRRRAMSTATRRGHES